MTHESRLAQALLDEMPLGVRIFDGHGHLGALGSHAIPSMGSAESVVALMDRVGIEALCFSHHLAIGPDTRAGNRMALEEAARYPGRLLVYLAFNPNHDLAQGVADLESHYQAPGVIGIKLHPGWHQAPTDDPRYHPAFDFARDHGLPVLVHSWGVSDVRGVETMARRYPGVPVILGHSGGYEFAANREAMRASRQNENLFLDLALSGMFEGVVEACTREAGEDKVLFGSDMPFFDPRPAIGRVVFARIADRQKEKILGENMRRLLGQPCNT